MGQNVFSDGVNIIDDPHRNRGLRSKPFDAEGLPNAKKYLAEDGVLKTWVMEASSRRCLEFDRKCGSGNCLAPLARSDEFIYGSRRQIAR